MKPLRVLIADDEPPARRRLRRLLLEIGGVVIAGEAGDTPATAAAIRLHRPDVVLLDIQMPGHGGVDLAARIDAPRPSIIFVTAHDAHAVRAFELDALDYLLKPVSRARLADAIGRAHRARSSAPSGVERDGSPVRLPVASEGRIQLVDVASIDWIESADNYAILHCGARRHILRDTMVRLAARLDSRRFARIHRSTIVQIDRVERLEPLARGDWTLVLRDGTSLTLSRTFRADVISRLKHT
jgi:two-component system LytT family response regulator